MKTVAQYVAERFVTLGIKHVFGIPGDYSFPIDNAFEKAMTWVGCANELNAGYAADGYARARGAALLCTTYGVGELSALNAMMGAKAERVPVFHIVGIPSHRLQRSHQVLHHSLGDGKFNKFFELSASAACVSAFLTPENVITEMERVIGTALSESLPAYLVLPADYALMKVIGKKPKISKKKIVPQSEPRELAAAIKQIIQRLAASENPIILPAFTIARDGLKKEFERLLKVSGIYYATMLMDKGVISESHPNYLGMYRGSTSEAFIKEAVESSDLILNLGGVLFSDLSTGFFSHHLNAEKVITIGRDFVEIRESEAKIKNYAPVQLRDILVGLTKAFEKKLLQKRKPKKTFSSVSPAQKSEKKNSRVTHESFYARITQFLKPQDHLIVESGRCTFEMAAIKLPSRTHFYNQSLWGSVGWATPASLGVALANPKDRVVLITGDGAHQFTANELGTMGRYGVNPIIFVMNDGSYAIEEFLDQNRGHLYNKLAPWSYAQLPEVMGCHDWLTMQIRTNAELEQALAKASQCKSACYFEILLGSHLRPPAPEALVEALQQKFPPQ